MVKEIFSYMEDDRLKDMDIAGLSGDDVERLIQEYYRRGGLGSDGEELFERLVHARLEELTSRYAELQCLFNDEQVDRKEETLEECAEHIRGKYCGQRQTEDDGEEASEDAEEPWPWPLLEVKAGAGGGEGVSYAHEHSGLNLCGHRVGNTYGRPPGERKRLLDYFYQRKPPNLVEKIHGDNYGAPNSSRRLKKMADNIAGNCTNKKKISAGRYRVAIADSETDLKYLKTTYYDGRFNWPST